MVVWSWRFVVGFGAKETGTTLLGCPRYWVRSEYWSGSAGIGDAHSPALAVEADVALNQREERVVVSLANALPGVELIAHLSDYDAARFDEFTAKMLHSASLCVRIATVAAGPLSLFMCHSYFLAGAELLVGTGVKRIPRPVRNSTAKRGNLLFTGKPTRSQPLPGFRNESLSRARSIRRPGARSLA